MADPDTKEAIGSEDEALTAIRQQRQKMLWWSIFGGLALCLITALFNPSLALLAGGAIVILGLYAGGVSWVARWIGRQIGG